MNGTDRPPPKGPDAGGTAAAAPGAAATERFDEILSRLRGVVDKLEAGNLPLEESLKFFEEGIALCRRGATILDSAERKVEVLLSSRGERPARPLSRRRRAMGTDVAAPEIARSKARVSDGADGVDWVAARRAEVDGLLRARLEGLRETEDPGRLIESLSYSLLAPGKRLRPLLALAAAEAAGEFLDDNVRIAAAAVELIHCYSLIHDDLPAMDDDDFRRGKPSNHKVFGEGMAILAGDALLTLAFEWLAEAGERAARPRAFGLATLALARGAGIQGMVRGQARDLSGAAPATLEALEQLHAEKTGALFRAAVEVGAAAAGGSAEDVAVLGAFGVTFGVAFQHADDLDDADHPAHADVARARREVLLSEALSHLDQLRRPERAGALRSLAAGLRGAPLPDPAR